MIHEKIREGDVSKLTVTKEQLFNLRLNLPISNEKIPIITQK